jgi:hypothetical protein
MKTFEVPMISALARIIIPALLVMLSACSHFNHSQKPEPGPGPRDQLSIGYSLLYQEANGIPKLKWLIRFKDKQDDMSRTTDELLGYYQQLAQKLEKLSTQFPAVRINVQPMSEIEADTRKAIGTDMAKDIAPVIGKSGIDFEREALLTFYNGLNEQRHLVRVMLEREKVPALRDFLETTRFELDSHYAKVEALLNRRYFKHTEGKQPEDAAAADKR